MEKKTRVVHAGVSVDPVTGASSPPLYFASTYRQADVTRMQEYVYSRSGNPTREALEKAVAELEGGAGAAAFASGVAAISAALFLFNPGDHLVVCEDIYGGTYNLLTGIFARWGLEHTFVDATDPSAVRGAIKGNTKALFLESPSNPLLKITDLRTMWEIAKDNNLLTIIDNTFCTPYLQRPISLGFDIVLHSGTKFLNGHSDVLAGIAVARTQELADRIRKIQISLGAVLGVQDSWLMLRGMRTLAVRMEQAQATARYLVNEMKFLPGVTNLYYPELSTNPGRDIHRSQADGGGAVFSFELESTQLALKFLQKISLPLVAVSLGGVESIISYPARMSHAVMPPEERERLGISDQLLRFSVGLESGEDLLKDMDRALREALAK